MIQLKMKNMRKKNNKNYLNKMKNRLWIKFMMNKLIIYNINKNKKLILKKIYQIFIIVKQLTKIVNKNIRKMIRYKEILII